MSVTSDLESVRICEIINPIHTHVTESSCYSHLLKEKRKTQPIRKNILILITILF